MSTQRPSSTTGARVLSAVLVLELLWVVLVAASIVFLAAHLGPSAQEFTGDATARGALLTVVPPLALVIGLALLGARNAVERVGAQPGASLSGVLRAALWLSAIANGVVAAATITSLYHAHTTWLVVGLVLALGLSAVARACVRVARAS